MIKPSRLGLQVQKTRCKVLVLGCTYEPASLFSLKNHSTTRSGLKCCKALRSVEGENMNLPKYHRWTTRLVA